MTTSIEMLNELLRQTVLQSAADSIMGIRDRLAVIEHEIEACEADPDRSAPHNLRGDTLDDLNKWLGRYRNIVQLRRLPGEHGSGAVRLALAKLGWTHFSGYGEYALLVRGYQHFIALNHPAGKLLTVTYHGAAGYGDPVWEMTDPTVGEVLARLGLELPFE